VWQHDPAIHAICSGWPQGISSARSRKLGFEMDKDLDEVVRNFIADDLDEQMKIAKPA
jgi:D-erythronate 2-dehydrogenase